MSLHVVACEAAQAQPDGTCLAPLWMPAWEPVLPPMTVEDGFLVSVAVLLCWAAGVKAKLVFRAARAGYWS